MSVHPQTRTWLCSSSLYLKSLGGLLGLGLSGGQQFETGFLFVCFDLVWLDMSKFSKTNKSTQLFLKFIYSQVKLNSTWAGNTFMCPSLMTLDSKAHKRRAIWRKVALWWLTNSHGLSGKFVSNYKHRFWENHWIQNACDSPLSDIQMNGKSAK